MVDTGMAIRGTVAGGARIEREELLRYVIANNLIIILTARRRLLAWLGGDCGQWQAVH